MVKFLDEIKNGLKNIMNFREYWDVQMKKRPIKDGQKIIMTKEQYYNNLLKAFREGAFSILNQAKNQNSYPANLDAKLQNHINQIFKDMESLFSTLFPKDKK